MKKCNSVEDKTRQNPGWREALIFFPYLCEFFSNFGGFFWSFQKTLFKKNFGLNKPKNAILENEISKNLEETDKP